MKDIKTLISEELEAVMAEMDANVDNMAPTKPPMAPADPQPVVDPSRVSKDTEQSLTGAGSLKAAKKISIEGEEGAFSGKIMKVQEMPNAVEITFMTPWKEVEKFLLNFDEVEELVQNKEVMTVSGKVRIF